MTLRKRSFPLVDRLESRTLLAVPSSGYIAPTMPLTASNAKQIIKVLVLNYEPLVPSQGNRPLWQLFGGWSDPRVLAQGYESDMEAAAGGAIDFEVVEWRDINAIPKLSDGYQYTPDQYYNNRLFNTGWHTGNDGLDVYEMMDQEGVAPLVASGAVDEVWMFGDHYFLPGESVMIGPRAYFINGHTYPNVDSARPFAMYGFSYERGVAEMVHNTGHRTENHLRMAYTGVWNRTNPQTNWDRFAASAGVTSDGSSGVGDTHFPANAQSDYDYANTRTVNSTAADWLNYPNLTGATTPITRSAWSAGVNPDYQRDYLAWMFGHLPRNAGATPDGRQNNWWKYIYDWDNYSLYSGLAKPFRVESTPENVTSYGASTYQFQVRYSNAVPVNVATLDSNDIRVTGPGGFSQLATLVNRSDPRNGNYRVATYQITAPGGTWDASDNGLYTLSLQPGQVTDAAGAAAAPGTVGTFVVGAGYWDFLSENNADQWTSGAMFATASVVNDTADHLEGNASLRFTTDGGFDTWMRYSAPIASPWRVDLASTLSISFKTQNPSSFGFQTPSPAIRLLGDDGSYVQFEYYQSGNPYPLLNDTRGQWKSYRISLNAPANTTDGWRRTVVGSPNLAQIRGIEIHADTWDYGFTMWVDHLGLDLPVPAAPDTPDLDAISDLGPSNDDNVTQLSSGNPLLFRGTAEPNVNVRLVTNGTTLGSTTATASGAWSIILTAGTLPEGATTIRAIASNLIGDSPASSSITVIIDNTAPQLVSSLFDVNSRQAAKWTYDEDIHGSLLDENIVVFGPSGSLNPSNFAGAAAGRTLTLSPLGNLLPDGSYTFGFVNAVVSDLAGNRITSSQLSSFILAADANRDRKVDFQDLLILAQNYGQAGKTFSQGNFNYSPDGLVDFADLLLLAQRYGTSLPGLFAVEPIAAKSATAAKKREPAAGDVVR